MSLKKIYQLLFCSLKMPFPLLIALLILLAVLNILDALLTWQVIKLGSNKNEKNPLARWLFNKIGPFPAMLLLKGIAVAIIAYITFNYEKFLPEIYSFATVLNIFYLYIVIHNHFVLKKMKKIYSPSPEEIIT